MWWCSRSWGCVPVRGVAGGPADPPAANRHAWPMTAAPATTDRFAADLRARIAGEVRSDPGHRALYAGDASNHRVVPACVVLPRTLDDVVATVARCSAEGVPVTTRGAGTGIAGGALGSGVVVVISAFMFIWAVLVPGKERRENTSGFVQPAE